MLVFQSMNYLMALFSKFKKKYRLTYIDFILLALAIFFNYAYFLMQNISPVGIHMDLPIDGRIPFLPGFIVFYMLYGLFLITGLILLWNKPLKRRALLISYAVVQIVSLSIFFFYQTAMARPELVVTGFLTYLVAYVYSGDLAVNCFPSLHAASITCVLYFNKERGILWWIFGLLIIVSILFVKQHYILDLFGGVALAILSVLLVSWVVKKYFSHWK